MFQALAGSDVGDLSFGSPINASALLIILLHQVIESHTLVRHTDALKAVTMCLTERVIRLSWSAGSFVFLCVTHTSVHSPPEQPGPEGVFVSVGYDSGH